MIQGAKLVSAIAIGLALSGCKTQVFTTVHLSQLQDESISQVEGAVRLEVPACNSYEDSRQPSNGLRKAMDMVPQIFLGAEFAECYSQNFNSWAQFDIPIAIHRGSHDEFATSDTVNLMYSGSQIVAAGVPPEFYDRIRSVQQQNPGMPELEMGVFIDVINDTESTLEAQAASAWVNDAPYLLGDIDIEAGSTLEITLSDVSVRHAMTYGYSPVLIRR